ncbi:hypothetical protein ABIF38_005720 [Bradyrhizobium japonicum]|jgi:hypothetical protein|uniref:hypothetical protein n=1 Tax=Bradyrhizobium TaxID=374 RepID=UPI00047741E4|nr:MULTISPECIES: hypothetical protein [Bradyrhizobium]MBP2434794.1 hypothetical protein [Bradyrhizobium elkanii]MCP1932769.1 hypothetical protein [Bradyrhizobium elkanii]MCS3479218.1 hypothetical protein [Bradyrhizobium elkanii]MCS3516186.1 hypothetical protein [Bradyrhizobium elkanii]MCS3576695.1 hypothetical protein [Bradyrhizobium elkanii]
MRPPRSALPLPRYVERKRTGAGWAHFFHVPTWAKRAGCPLHSEALGLDYAAAVKRAEEILLPAFDAWRTGDTSTATTTTPAIAAAGTLDWVFAEYRADRRFTKLDPKSRRNHEVGFKLVGGYVLKDGKRLGEKRIVSIDTALTDDLYEKLLVLKVKDSAGNIVERERRTTVNHAMKSCRRAWNVCARRNPGRLPIVNPFARMGLRSSDRETPTATYEELVAFRIKAGEMNLHSLATASLIAWEWLQRETDIFATFDASHYRPKDRPDLVCVIDEKTGSESWIPLFDEIGVPLYPELMAELDAIKRERIGGLMLVRDWGNRGPWPTWPKPDMPDFTHMSRKVKEVVRAAGLRDELSFTSFRHGGLTETGDAELTDREILAQSRHTTVKVLPRYVKRTQKQIATGTKKRRAARTKGGHLSE